MLTSHKILATVGTHFAFILRDHNFMPHSFWLKPFIWKNNMFWGLEELCVNNRKVNLLMVFSVSTIVRKAKQMPDRNSSSTEAWDASFVLPARKSVWIMFNNLEFSRTGRIPPSYISTQTVWKSLDRTNMPQSRTHESHPVVTWMNPGELQTYSTVELWCSKCTTV